MVESRIVILTTQLEPAGAQKASSTLSKLLHVNGINNRLVFLFKKIEFNYLKDYEIPHDFLLSSNRIGLFDIPLILFKLYRLKPELLIAFTHYSIFLSILLKLFRWDLKIVACHRNPKYSYPIIVKIWINIFQKMIDTHTFVSTDTKKSFYKTTGEVIVNPIGFHNQRKQSKSNGFGERFVLCVGRLSTQKNYINFIKSIQHYKGILKVKIVGDGPLKDEINQLLIDNNLQNTVELLGNIGHDEVIELMKTSDCYIMPSSYEGTSNSLIEALYYSKIVAINNVPSLVETATYNDKVYALVKERDFSSWVELLESIEKNIFKKDNHSIYLNKKFNNSTFLQKFEKIIMETERHQH